jgi:hypothetical protein
MGSVRWDIRPVWFVWHWLHVTVPISFSLSITQTTDLLLLQKGQLKVTSSLALAFFGGGLLDFRLPIFAPQSARVFQKFDNVIDV